MKAGRHICQKEVANAKKDHGGWDQLINYPVDYRPAALLQRPQTAPTLPPCFQDHPRLHSLVPALLFLLLPKGTVFLENIFCCFSGLLPSYSPSEEQNVTSGLHLYWVRFQSPPPLLKSSSVPPTGFQRPWLACASLAGFVSTLPPHPWGFSAAPAEGLTSIFNPFFFCFPAF